MTNQAQHGTAMQPSTRVESEPIEEISDLERCSQLNFLHRLEHQSGKLNTSGRKYYEVLDITQPKESNVYFNYSAFYERVEM